MKKTILAVALLTSFSAFAEVSLDTAYKEVMDSLPQVEAFADVLSDCKTQVKIRGVIEGMASPSCVETINNNDRISKLLGKVSVHAIRISKHPKFISGKQKSDVSKIVQSARITRQISEDSKYLSARLAMQKK